jgi:hypothetical protein
MEQTDSMATAPDNPESPLLTQSEAAAYLRIAKSTFIEQVSPLVPQVRPTPGRVLFRRADLNKFIEEQARVAP